MEIKELEQYVTTLINTTDIDIESYNKSFFVRIEDNSIKIIFRFPVSFVVDSKLYFKIYNILNVPLFPILSLTPQSSMIVEEFKSNDINSARCLKYPFEWGVPKRQIYDNLEDFKSSFNADEKKWNIMSSVEVDFKNVTSICVGGQSGSGKSYLMNQFLEVLNEIAEELIIVDGKKDLPAKFGKNNNLTTYFLDEKKSYNELLEEVCRELEKLNLKIMERQDKLFKNEVAEEDLKLIVLAIDEIGALVALADKKIKENFFRLLSICAVTGRQSKVMLVLSTQRFDANTIPTLVKEQCNFLIQLGSLTSNNLQYLFPDFVNNDILLPLDNLKKGIGLISLNDNVKTFLVPTVKNYVI